MNNKRNLILILCLIFIASCNNVFNISNNDMSEKVFEKMDDITVYNCYCLNYDSTIVKNIMFSKSENTLNNYYLDFNVPYSRPDTFFVKENKVFPFFDSIADTSSVVFDFESHQLFDNREIYFNSGLGISMSLIAIHKDIYEYSFDGISSHSNYISRMRISLKQGILDFNWYDGKRNFICTNNNQ